MNIRNRIARRLALLALSLATPQYRARVHIALVTGMGGQPGDALLNQANFARLPGE